MSITRPQNDIENRLLTALPKSDYKRLRADMELITPEQGDVLIRPGEPVPYVYFPINSMISMVALLENGATVEAGCVGNEGVVGIPTFLGASSTPMESVVQIPGQVWRMKSDRFKEEFDNSIGVRKVLLLYMHTLVCLISQTAACNKLHPITARLARWVLIGSDSVLSNELPLTHEFLATMLGVRRAGVTEAASELRGKGLISYGRGHLAIVNREGLEEESCECYRVVRRELERLL